MINLQFFPSRRIALYMAKLFVSRSVAVLFALVWILMMLEQWMRKHAPDYRLA